MNISTQIIFEDNHILIVFKIPNLLSQADVSRDKDLLSLLKQHLKERDKKPGNVYLGLVHRLDRPTSGLMVFAKTSKAASRLAKQIREREFKKVYFALVEGVPQKKEDKLQHYLVKNERQNKVLAFSHFQKNSKEAILEYSIERTFRTKSLLRINLITGRSHQIRCQLSAIEHPIIGDLKYGFSKEIKWDIKKNGIALYSKELKFLHPTQKTECVFTKEPDWDI